MTPDDLRLLQPFPRGRFSHVLFDFDGTISLLREGWQGIMTPTMIEMITGGAVCTPEIAQAVDDYIEDSTGIQTIVQMEHLVTMVREFGLVPESEVRSATEYKAIYNARLLEPVRARIAALAAGNLSLNEVTVPGSREFVGALSERGLTLYIFSGTDREDVIAEAGVLGVSDHFEEIWGAIGNVQEYSKEKVLRELMEAHGLAGDEVLIVGDGPVEVRNGRSSGCATLGVCSDESRGAGWDEAKVRRLTGAGAHALVPDFSSHDEIAGWLLES